jgi:hypothetical protein
MKIGNGKENTTGILQLSRSTWQRGRSSLRQLASPDGGNQAQDPLESGDQPAQEEPA